MIGWEVEEAARTRDTLRGRNGDEESWVTRSDDMGA